MGRIGQTLPEKDGRQPQSERGTEEVRAIDEEKRSATAAVFAKQCAWSCWEEAEQRKRNWPTLAQMEPLRISFLLSSTYDLLPTPTNLKQWGIIDDDICLQPNACRDQASPSGIWRRQEL
ncbi:hypothetical protein ACROYT_G013711 [Oculina patagonica]